MKIWEAILLGLIQGATEFLPVSSSGHLVLAQNIMGITEGVLTFDIAVHIATMIAVIAVMRKEILPLVRKPLCSLNRKLIIATVPTIIIAIIIEYFLSNMFSGRYLGWGFLVGAAFLAVGDFVSNTVTAKKLSALNENISDMGITYPAAVVMGISQGIAVIPGISRSGTTISAGLIMGAERESAAKFSFLMSIPVILGSLIFDAADIGVSVKHIGILPLLAGFASALAAGYLAAKLMLKIIGGKRFWIFAVYLAVMSVVSFIII